VPEDALQELVEAIAEHSADRALGLVHRFQREGRNLQHFCREAIRHIRNLLIARVCGADSELIAATPDQRPGLAKAAALFSEEDLTRFFQILLQTDDDVRRKMDPRVHLEMGLLRLVNAARLAPLEELLAEVNGSSSGRAGGGSAPRGATPGSSAPNVPTRAATAGTSSEAAPWTAPVQAKVEAKSVAAAAGASLASLQSFAAPASMSSHGANGSAAAEAPAKIPAPETAAAKPEADTAVHATGLTAEEVVGIKMLIQTQQKFVGELLEHASRWELESGELRIYFSPEKSTFAGLIEGREALEKIRAASGKVLGRSVRVCARLESGTANDANASRASSTQEMRAQFENDPLVKSMLQRFGGRISEVRRRNGE
jgi:DNA polymerase III subunit gamma/tau